MWEILELLQTPLLDLFSILSDLLYYVLSWCIDQYLNLHPHLQYDYDYNTTADATTTTDSEENSRNRSKLGIRKTQNYFLKGEDDDFYEKDRTLDPASKRYDSVKANELERKRRILMRAGVIPSDFDPNAEPVIGNPTLNGAIATVFLVVGISGAVVLSYLYCPAFIGFGIFVCFTSILEEIEEVEQVEKLAAIKAEGDRLDAEWKAERRARKAAAKASDTDSSDSDGSDSDF